MTGLFKCVVLSCAFSLVFGFTSVRDDANWFKDGQRIKNRFVTGVVNGIVDVHCNNSSNGEDVEGECLSKLECTKIGGKVGSLCSLLGSCCVIEKTCNDTTSSKLSYFVSPKQFQTECGLTVKVYSKDVCQIRLDFEKFDIAKPTNREVKKEGESYYTSYQCHDDEFTVESGKTNLGFPHLCGKNNKQHIYIPVAENQQNVQLNFHLKEREGTNLPQPEWRIKIRQLECRKSGYENLFNAPSKLMAMYNNLKNKKKPKSDYDLIAPPHCLQYYPKTTGTFESFNYDEGRGCYIGKLNYAICFRKAPEICSATFTAAGLFQMNSNKFTGEGEEREKCHPKSPASPKVSQDYLVIPRGVNGANDFQDYYCNTHFDNGNIVTVKTSQLIHVGVHTDEFRANKVNDDKEEDDDFAEIGFKLRYDLKSGSCDVPI